MEDNLYTRLAPVKRRDRLPSEGREESLAGDWSDEEARSSMSSESAEEFSLLRALGCRQTRPQGQRAVLPRMPEHPPVRACGSEVGGSPRRSPLSPKRALRQRLEACRQETGDLKQELDGVTARGRHVRAKAREQTAREHRLLMELERLEHLKEGRELPGPHFLLFLEGNIFTFFVSLVILANVTAIYLEMAHPHYKDDFYWLDNAFLIFYVVELVLKAFLWQGQLLCGPCIVVWSHWLDLVIVISGIVDMWLMPLFFTRRHGMSVITCFRALRLARVAKLVHSFVTGDTSWAESEPFQIFVMVLIALSSFLMGLECDYPWLTTFLDEIYWEQVVLAIFVFELGVRLKNSGLRFFVDPRDWAWNWLDFVVVAGGTIDQGLIPLTRLVGSMLTGKPANYSSNMGQWMIMLRMARLLRILRLVKLVRKVPQLFNLLSGITQAMAGMVWVLLLTIIVLYFFALLSVKLFRDGMVFGGEAPASVKEIFPTIEESIFVLFTVMDGHKGVLDPLMEVLPVTKVVFMLFVMISEWAMLSILTAVVSENMIAVTEARKEELDSEEQGAKDRDHAEKLNDLFSMMDTNQDGCLNMLEFDNMIKDEDYRHRLCKASNLNVMDLRLIFNIIERNGCVPCEAFIEACQHESKAVSERSLMKLDKRLAGVEEKISTTSITVEGAGIESMNGVYEESGSYNLKPLYKNIDRGGSTSIIYFDFVWKMNDCNNTSTWRYRMSQTEESTSALCLHRQAWIASDSSCGAIPTVRWESRSAVGQRIQRLEGILVEVQQDLRRLNARLKR